MARPSWGGRRGTGRSIRWYGLLLTLPVLATAGVSVAYLRAALAQRRAVEQTAVEVARVMLRDGVATIDQQVTVGLLRVLRRTREIILRTEAPATPLQVVRELWRLHDSVAACRCEPHTPLRSISVMDRTTHARATLPVSEADSVEALIARARDAGLHEGSQGRFLTVSPDGPTRTGLVFAMTSPRGPAVTLILELDLPGLEPLFRAAFSGAFDVYQAGRPGAPASLIGYRLLYPDGATLTSHQFSPTASHAAFRLWPDSATGKAFSAVVSIPEAAIATIVPGGMPDSPWPLVIGSIVLSALLTVLAIIGLRRIHALAVIREEFVSGITHEIRTPITQILLLGETLQLERPTPEARKRAAEIIVREARRLSHLVENALLFARGRRPEVGIAPTSLDLGDAVAAAVQDRSSLFRDGGVQVQVVARGRVPVLLDPTSVDRIVGNLLENAVRYGPPGQTIRVETGLIDGGARLVVEDEGPGIDPADHDRIWQPFVRLGSANATGAGLGLSIVRQLVEVQQGTVSVGRSAGGGARFAVLFPGAPPSPNGRPDSLQPPGDRTA